MATNRLAQFFEDVGKRDVERSRQALAQSAYGRQLAESALGTSANVLGTFGRLADQGLQYVPSALALYALDKTPEAEALSQKMAFDRDQIFNRLTNPTMPNPDPKWKQVFDVASATPIVGAVGRGLKVGGKVIGKAASRISSLFDDVSKTSQDVAKVNKVRSVVKQDLDEARNAVNAAKQAKEAYKSVGSSYDEAYNAGSDFKRIVERAMQTGNKQKFLLPNELAKHNRSIADAASEARGLRESFNFLTGEYGQAAKVAKAADEALAKAVKETAKRTAKVAEKTGKGAAKGYMGMQAAGVPASAVTELMAEPAGLSPEDVENVISNRERNSFSSVIPNYVEDYAYAHEANPIEPTSRVIGTATPETRVVEAAQPTPAYVGSPTYNYLAGRPNVITPTQRLVQEAQAVPQDVDLTNLPSYKKLQEIAANAKTQEEVINQLTQQQAARRKALADESDNSIMRWIGHILTLPFALRRGESPALTWARTQAGIEANDTELSAINQQLAAAAGLPTKLSLAQAMNAANIEALTKGADIQSKKDKSYLQSRLAEANAQRLEAVKEKTEAELALKQARVDQDREKLNNDIKAARAKLGVAEANLLKSQIEGALNFGFGSVPSDEALAAREAIANLEPGTLVKYKYALLTNPQGQAGDKLLSIDNLKASAFSK